MKHTFRFLLLALSVSVCTGISAQRKFKHPGISYTQADIDRMKAMVEAKQEPFYSGFIALRDSNWYTRYRDYTRPLPTASNGEPVIWDNPNLWLDTFGQVAFNNALLWRLTGESAYADKAVAVLNRYAPVRSVKPYGTNPLDASKAWLLIEAAELMRDYEGWDASDQQGFKDFLVYPGYSTKEDYYRKYANGNDTVANKVTIYWNVFQGDPNRHGNQGLYAMRCLMAMGIYLDNDTIYDRALRKVLSLGHRPDDLAYPSGPNITPYAPKSQNEYFESWALDGTGDTEDYGSDDELKYWIYENGQCQESSRDQGHILDGLCGMMGMGKIAWNQGDDIFTQYGNRLLKGIIFTTKYNYGWLNNHVYGEAYWQGEDDFEPTVENGQFLRVRSRNNRWRSLKINPWDENYVEGGNNTWSRGKRFWAPTQILMPYKVRLQMPADSILWLQRAYDMDMDSLLQQRKLTSEGMTDYRTAWMAGDAGTFSNGLHVSGIPMMPGIIKAADYDYFNDAVTGNGRTYFTTAERTDNLYRQEGGMQLRQDGSGYVVTALKDGSWMNYTFSVAKAGTYEIKVKARMLAGGARIGFAVDGSSIVFADAEASGDYVELPLGKLKLAAGARVLRIYVSGTDDAVDLKDIIIQETEADGAISDYVWNSRDYQPVDGGGMFLTDQGAAHLYTTSFSSTSQAVFTMSSDEVAYRVGTDKRYLVMCGENLSHGLLKKATYRLTDTSADVSKTMTAGQASNYFVDNNVGGKDMIVWKLDSTSSKRIKPLLNDCLNSDGDSWILRQLTLIVYGASLRKPVVVDDLQFCTEEEVNAFYPVVTAIREVRQPEENMSDSPVYDLSGRRVSHPVRGIYIRNNCKIVIK